MKQKVDNYMYLEKVNNVNKFWQVWQVYLFYNQKIIDPCGTYIQSQVNTDINIGIKKTKKTKNPPKNMYVNNTKILLLIYNVYIYDYSFGVNKNTNKRTLIVKLKETRNFSKYIALCAK